ncbi:MAG: DUF2141 domain-containing protein [Saprospiraceae bacterium]
MKTSCKIGLAVLCWLTFVNLYLIDNQGKLLIEVSNIKTAKGTIWAGVYHNPKDLFNQEQAIVKAKKVSKTGKTYLSINELRYGAYVVALFHDINGNNKLDQNALGVPTEPYAFSQLPKSKWRLPKFDEVKFYFRRDNQVLKTPLQRW